MGYRETRRAQINAAVFQAAGYPIGSGVVESANPFNALRERRRYATLRAGLARSSSGLGRRPFKAEIRGSNPLRATKFCILIA